MNYIASYSVYYKKLLGSYQVRPGYVSVLEPRLEPPFLKSWIRHCSYMQFASFPAKYLTNQLAIAILVSFLFVALLSYPFFLTFYCDPYFFFKFLIFLIIACLFTFYIWSLAKPIRLQLFSYFCRIQPSQQQLFSKSFL